jgi:hypothetical protein
LSKRLAFFNFHKIIWLFKGGEFMVPNDDIRKITMEDEADESAEPMDIDAELEKVSGEGDGYRDVTEDDLERKAIVTEEEDENPL